VAVPAVVVDYGRGRTIGESLPEGNASRRVEAVVRPVHGDGRHQSVSGRLAGHTTWLMAEGDEISVLVDADGRVVDFDRPTVDARYAERKDELRAARRHLTSMREYVGVDRAQVAEVPRLARALLSVPRRAWRAATSNGDAPTPPPPPPPTGDQPPPPPGDPAPPVDGVAFSTFVAVQAALVREAVPPARHDEVASRFGVPAGHWAPAASEWHRLVRSDPALGRAFGAAYQAALLS
jgi:hypothetical protein